MATSPDRARRRHAERASALEGSQADLEASSAREAEARENLAAARAREAEARLLLVDATRRRTELQERVQTLSRRLDASRSALSRLCVAALPDDVLRCIFEAVISPGELGYDAAFDLAKVCAQWRRVALCCSALWSNISPPILDEDNVQRNYCRVVRMLARSRAAPLRVAIAVRLYPINSLTGTVKAARELVWAVNRHAPRWVTASFDFIWPRFSGEERAKFRPLEGLKCPTPLLTALYLALHNAGTWHLDGEYLPFAPALRTLGPVTGLELACSTQSTFPALTAIELSGDDFSYTNLSGYFLRAPALKRLCIPELTVNFDAPRAALSLSALEFLGLGQGSQELFFEPTASAFHLPKLAELSFSGVPEDALVPFLTAVSPTVLRLSISEGPLTVKHVDVLLHLERVEYLDVDKRPVDGGIVDDDVFDLLTSTSPAVWPRLTSIETPYFMETAEQILRLILARNPPPVSGQQGAPSNAGAQPWSWLTEVNFGRYEPTWIREEIDRLLL